MNHMLSLGWPWTPTRIFGRFYRLYPDELAHEWGEAIWTARDLWEVRS